MTRGKSIRGFDYELGVPCEHTAREWDVIRLRVFERGGFARRVHGEEWLLYKGHRWAFEIYWHERATHSEVTAWAPLTKHP